MTYDLLGYPIEVGDLVAYAPTGRVDVWGATPSIGIVKEIEYDQLKAGKMQKFRNASQVINLKFMKPLSEVQEELPELFI